MSMAAISGTGDFQCRRNMQLAARLHDGAGILSPVGFVEISSQEKTGVIGQEWINPDGMFSGQVVKEYLISHRQQQALGAVTAFDLRFVADTGLPFVPAGR